MPFVSKFGERLSELMMDQNITPEVVAKNVGVSLATVYEWKREKYMIYLDHLVKLANLLHCSIDFLIGRSDTVIDFTPKECPPFYARLREVMAERNKTRYRLVKDTGIQDSRFSKWKQGENPQLYMLEKLATYLDVTVDYLVGRDR